MLNTLCVVEREAPPLCVSVGGESMSLVANQYSNLSVSDGKLKNHLIDLPFIAPSYIAEVSK